MAIRRSSSGTPSATRIGAVAAASALVVGGLVLTSSDSVTGVISAVWWASGVLHGGG